MNGDIQSLYDDLDNFNSNLVSIINESNTINLESINDTMVRLERKKKDLQSKYSDEELKRFNKIFTYVVKQIKNNVDSIIVEKKKEMEIIASDLIRINNKKKIMKYKR